MSDQDIRELNRDYRGLDKPTDVLSFAQNEGQSLPLIPGIPRLLGDIMVSVETTRRQAGEAGVSFLSELAWVVAHGTLHLLGHDHQSESDLQAMRHLERQALATVGMDCPR